MEKEIDFKCNISDLPVSQYDIVKILPNWKTQITNVVEDQWGNLTIKFLICAKTKEEIREWVDAYQEKSTCTYTIKSTDPATGRYIMFKQRLHCHHKTKCDRLYNPSVKNKTRNTNCPSKIKITLRAIKQRYKGKDINLKADPEMPCMVELVATHNHLTNCADALRFRPVGDEAREKLIVLFENGHTPASALEEMKLDIYLNHEDNFEKILADRKYTPDYGYCHRLFTKEFEKRYEPMDFNENSEKKLIESIKAFNERSKENCVEMFISESQYAICICPPLMKRVHRLVKASAEIVFMDSIGRLDHIGSRVFVLLTHNECGALPLAVIITSSESSECLCKGFQMLKGIVGTDLFGGSVNGPKLFMTDNSASEQAAVNYIWTNSECLLCTFHVLQSLWRWLITSKNCIKEEDRYKLFQDFRTIMYANSISECEENYKKAVSKAAKYPGYVTYLEEYYWKRKELWALCYRGNKLTRGNDTIVSEAIMRVLKDKIDERVKVNNMTHLMDFIFTKFIRYFEMRLLDVAHCRSRKNMFGQLIKMPPPELLEKIQTLTNKIHLVPSEEANGLFYVVNTEVLICTCPKGKTGKICKHLNWVCFLVHSDEYNKAIHNVRIRETMYFIATGTNADAGCLAPLFTATVNNNVPVSNLNNTTRSNVEDVESVYCNDENLHSKDVADDFNNEEILNEVKEILGNITSCIYNHAKESPVELRNSLKIMEDKLNKLKTPSAVSSACANYSNEFPRKKINNNRILVQPTTVGRMKTNICSRSRHSRGRPRSNNFKLSNKSKILSKKKAGYMTERIKEKYKTALSDLSTQ